MTYTHILTAVFHSASVNWLLRNQILNRV